MSLKAHMTLFQLQNIKEDIWKNVSYQTVLVSIEFQFIVKKTNKQTNNIWTFLQIYFMFHMRTKVKTGFGQHESEYMMTENLILVEVSL